ncbi:MAG: hypothetical protein U0R24_10410 [Solirubrobacterales bacterium]
MGGFLGIVARARMAAIGAGSALAALVVPGDAVAATTIGSSLASPASASAIDCGGTGGCTLANHALAPSSTAAGGLASSADGVIVRWRIRIGSSSSAITPRVIRTVSPGTYTAAGTGTAVTPAANQISTYDTRLPIKAGDMFGIDQAGVSFNRVGGGGGYSRWATPLLADGGPARSPSSIGVFELLINADVEADADEDGFGDETQDECPTDASTQGACPDKTAPETTITKAPKRKVKKGRVKVAFSSSEASGTFECKLDSGDYKACSSPATFRVKRGRHSILVRAIDAAGNADATPAEAKFKRKRKRR